MPFSRSAVQPPRLTNGHDHGEVEHSGHFYAYDELLTEGQLDRMKLLLSAYACLPNAGSEPGNGWNWAVHLAERGICVTVLTRLENKTEIEAYQNRHPIANLTFAYVTVPGSMIRPATSLHYSIWQWRAVGVARELHQEDAFDLIHHVTYTSIHMPSQLWRLNLPTVFGPVGGGQTTPPSMLIYFGTARHAEFLRTVITKLLRFSPLHRLWLSKFRVVFAANRDTLNLLKALGRLDVQLQFDNGISFDDIAKEPRHYDDSQVITRFLWVGRLLPRKALPLALDALSRTTRPSTLTIAGDGLAPALVEAMIEKRGLRGRVEWAGRRLNGEEVRSAYLEHDALVFTSVRETSGVQLLEAMALGLPLICLDLHGASDVVPDTAGYKVPAVTPAQVTEALAAALDRFSVLPREAKHAMSIAGIQFARQNTWQIRAQRAEELYRELLMPANSASRELVPTV
jgi:glycosyltransferase involved in cell wall biosynthesis